LSVSSVSSSSSSSIWWEEYLEKQKKLQQQAASDAVLELEAATAEKNVSAAVEEAGEKIASGAEATASVSVKLVGPSGMSGGASASIKWIEALVKEEEEEEDELSLVEDLAETLEEYLEELEEIDEAVNQ
jgi:hypothetical protein